MLFSPAEYSSLPGMPFPGDPEHYPTRDEVVAYLRGYAETFALPVTTGARVAAVDRDGASFRVSTTGGATFATRSVIAATGSFGNPYVPELPGRSEYQGRVLHAFDYREPSAFEGQRIVGWEAPTARCRSRWSWRASHA